MGRLTLAMAILMAGLWVNSASASSHVNISEEDCQAIKDGTIAPKSVPADVREACDQLLAMAPAAGSDAAADSPIDPCGAAGSGGSVYCWGPWAALAPAAGGYPDAGPAVDPIQLDPTRELLAVNNIQPPDNGVTPPIEPPIEPPIQPPVVPVLPLGGCAPGASCGFTSVVAGVTAQAPAEDTAIERYELAADGTQFTVAPGEAGEIQSFTMQTQFTDPPDGLEILTSTFVDDPNDPAQASIVQARVVRDGDGEILAGADYWAKSDNGDANSGFFVWSRAVSQSELDTLNSMGGATLNFSGVMSVDNSTVANITMNFGSESSWTGNWTNPNYNFSAGGAISGPNFGSDPSQFSNNVQDGYVQGALVGALGNRAAAHVIDVTLDSPGAIRDVGLALETP